MNHHDMLIDTASRLVAAGKGILAADESTGTMNKRLEAENIPADVERRRDFRELILTTPGLGEWISGVILFDETFRQATTHGQPLPEAARQAGMLPGIKVDTGAKQLAGSEREKVTEGLDGLRDRLNEYASLGAYFAKWRAVILIADGLPTGSCISANAHALARYAALCQEAGIVPIVEPEVLMDGSHTVAECADVTSTVLKAVFDELRTQRVLLEGIVLKPNMVVPGIDSPSQVTVDDVADQTLRCLRQVVPAAVPGVAFLSGGQSDRLATLHLDAMNRKRAAGTPWQLTFSYGRALLAPTLSAWRGDPARLGSAQKVLAHRARCNAAARDGIYTDDMER